MKAIKFRLPLLAATRRGAGLISLLVGGYVLWFSIVPPLGREARERRLDSLSDYDYICEIRALEAEGRLEEAKYLADFVLDGSEIASRGDVAALREQIALEQSGFWNRAYRAGKGFVTGEGASVEELGGAVVADFLLFGDIRDLAKQGYRKVRGEETDPVVAALASVGILTSLASFWVADPAEAAEVTADASLSLLKTLRKAGNLSRKFCGALVDACKKSAKAKSATKTLKEILGGMKGLFESAGGARTAAIMRHVDGVESLKAVSAMAKRAPEPTALLVRLHGAKGVKILGEMAKAEDGAVILAKAARKGPAALGKALEYMKYGARTAKSLRLGRPQKLLGECLRLLGRAKLVLGAIVAILFGLWQSGILRLRRLFAWAARCA